MIQKTKAWLVYNQAGAIVGAFLGAFYGKILSSNPSVLYVVDLPKQFFSFLFELFKLPYTEWLTIIFTIIFFALLGAFIQSKIRRTKIG